MIIGFTRLFLILKGMPNTLKLLRILKSRNFSTIVSRSDINSKFDTRFSELITESRKHRACQHSFFNNYLKNQSEIGYNASQIVILRDNFFERTQNTAIVVAKALIRALKEERSGPISDIGKNLFEETGSGVLEQDHPSLLKRSFGLFCYNLFGILPVNFKDIAKSPHLIPEVSAFKEMQEENYSKHSSWGKIAGCMYAHEDRAFDMLSNLYKYVIKPYEGYFDEKEFKIISAYFNAHIKAGNEGKSVEENHGDTAFEVIRKMCSENPYSIIEVREGIISFLDAQANLWDGLSKKMEASKDFGIIVPVKPLLTKYRDDSKDEFSRDIGSGLLLMPRAKKLAEEDVKTRG